MPKSHAPKGAPSTEAVVNYRGRPFHLPVAYQKESPDTVATQHWFFADTRAYCTYLEYMWKACEMIERTSDKPLRVLEVFGGTGATTRGFARKIEHHVAFDLDASCKGAFLQSFPDCKFVVGDAYTLIDHAKPDEFDVVLLEFNSMTWRRMLKDPFERAFFEKIVALRPRHILFVDSAAIKLHLHTDLYGDFLGREIQNPKWDKGLSYAKAVADHCHAAYGYGTTYVGRDRINFGFLFDRDSPKSRPAELFLADQHVDMEALSVRYLPETVEEQA